MPGKCLTSKLWIIMYLAHILNYVESAVKLWNSDTNVMNPNNWVQPTRPDGCKGLNFPNSLDVFFSIDKIRTEDILLPEYGEIGILDGGYIEFTQKSDCIKMKSLQYKKWLDVNSWNDGYNSAIPDAEKVPCQHDDVLFLDRSTFAITCPRGNIRVNSILINGKTVPTNDDWQEFLRSQIGLLQFSAEDGDVCDIIVEESVCHDKQGCLCHDDKTGCTWAEVCGNKEHVGEVPCLEPIVPIGHCHHFCGGTIYLKPSSNFDLERFKKQIPKTENVDSHASKVQRYNDTVIQVVFAEKDYSGLSADVTSDFHKFISKNLKKYRVLSATFKTSGPYFPTRSGYSLSIFLGTFLAALVLFSLIYLIFAGPLENYRLHVRIPFDPRSVRNMRPYVFARFENKEEGSVAFGDQSVAGSVISLDKAFDNPMYGTSASSSSTTTDVTTIDTRTIKTETTHENPMFDIITNGEELKAAEEF